MRCCKSSGKRYWRCDVVLAVLWLAVSPAGELATLVRVVDGDTIWVRLDSREEHIRYLGINAPERDTVCGKVATKVNRLLLQGKELRLVRDTDASNRDTYGRLLRYVYADRVLVNAELVRQGVAHARRYEAGIDYYPQFAQLEQAVSFAQKGCLVHSPRPP